jgi:3-hydroxybutyryl-CoA dehydrogenase
VSNSATNNQLVGVIGAGVMGAGVAQNLAQSGYDVVLIDNDPDALETCRKEIRNGVRFAAMFSKGDKEPQDPDEILQTIDFTGDYGGLSNAFFVIENVSETWPAKQSVYPQLDAACPADTVYAANTSCYSITRLGALTNRPDKVLGIHFMNPVPMKPTVEMIRGHHTTEETISIAGEVLAKMGKDYVLVNDSPGFVSNRVLMLMINEAVFVLQEGVAEAEQVDTIFKKCFGHKMGPLETADLIGLDTILNSVEVLHESFGDSKYRPCPLLKKMVDAGQLGRKSGRGFYPYKQGV